jgi:DNA-binding response OmpR family regulator
MSDKRTILIAEDDALLQKMYRMKFIVEGYNVQTAGDGRAALEKLKDFPPDVVLLDILMPRLDGMQVLSQMKHDEILKGIPVIMLTNQSSIDKVQEAVSIGADGYLIKSQKTPNEVVHFVNDVMTRRLQ